MLGLTGIRLHQENQELTANDDAFFIVRIIGMTDIYPFYELRTLDAKRRYDRVVSQAYEQKNQLPSTRSAMKSACAGAELCSDRNKRRRR